MSDTIWSGAGFHGKVPARGDFVSRGLPAAIVDTLDTWLGESVAEVKGVLRDGWLDAYLGAPVWHFATDPGLVGAPVAATGVVIPSVDKVGRYFPLVLLAPLAGEGTLLERLFPLGAWRRRVEDTALWALEEGTGFDDFVSAVGVLGAPAPAIDVDSLGPAVVSALEQPLRARLGSPLSLWWTEGSERVPPSLVAARGLPAPAHFVGFFDGDPERFRDGAELAGFPPPGGS